MSEKKKPLDLAKVKKVFKFQSAASRADIPAMFFLDRDDMAEARSNMELGAALKAEFFYYVPERTYLH